MNNGWIPILPGNTNLKEKVEKKKSNKSRKKGKHRKKWHNLNMCRWKCRMIKIEMAKRNP